MMIKQVVYLFFLILINKIQIIYTKSEPNYLQYLQKFGYTPKDGTGGFSASQSMASPVQIRLLSSPNIQLPLNEGIKTFQRLYKLPVSYFISIIQIFIFIIIFRKQVNLMEKLKDLYNEHVVEILI